MKLKKLLTVFILFLLYFIFNSISYSYSISNDLEENLFRLHIIANSDSEEDQNLKLFIRDNVINYLKNYQFSNKTELITFLKTHENELHQVIQTAINQKGYNYNFTIEIGNSFFPQKKYENIILPSGYYDGLKIKIGKAEGKNWWCVLFPPMCLINESTCELPEESELILENSLSEECNSIVSSDTQKYKFKFKIVDFFNNLHS